MLKSLAVFTMFLATVGCGKLNTTLVSQINKGTVVLARDVKAKVQKGSYIVAFKTSSRKTQRDFLTHRSLYLNYFNYVNERFSFNRGIKNLDFMTAVDLSVDIQKEREWLDVLNPAANLIKGPFISENEESTTGLLTEVEFEDEQSAEKILNFWAKKGDIWFAEPNFINEQFYSQYAQALERVSDKYWLTNIKLAEAYNHLASESRSTASSPIIAVMDSGVEYDHPALAERMFENARVGLSDCKNDVYGCNTTAGKKDILGNGEVEPFDRDEGGSCPEEGLGGSCAKRCCHGTHVAGLIAAYSGNGDGLEMMGVCPMCQVIAVRVVRGKGAIPDTAIIRGLIYVTRFQTDGGQAIRVVNASFGKFQASRAVGAMVRALKKTGNGITIIAAAGNEDTMLRAYPAAFPDAIAVSNISQSGPKHTSSNFGPWVDVAANGDQLNSTIPGKTYEAKTGTSMSAPVVSGLAGLLLSAEPGLSANGLRDRIIKSSNASRLYDDGINANGYYPKVSGSSVRVPLLGSGMIDAEKAVKADFSSTIASAEALNRVGEGCGQIGIAKSGKALQGLWLFLLCGLIPSLVARKKFK